MNNRAFQKLHMTNASRLCRRGIAAVLSGALTLGLITPGAFAWDDTADVHIPVEGEKPLITIESNGVIDDFGNLTGYLEVALRIKLPEGQTFTSLGVSLEYNSDILTPVNWVDSEGETTLVDMAGTTSDSYKTQALFRTLKDKQITTAISHVSGPYTLSVDPEEPAPGPSGEEGGEDAPAAQADGTPNGLFYIAAETSKPVTLEGDTMLAAVRFQYDLNKLDQTQNPWLNLPDGVKLPDGVDASNYDSTKWLPDGDNWLIRFAPDAVAAGSFVNQQLFYISGKGTQNDKNKFYYSEEGAASVGQVVAVKDSDGTLNRTSNLLTYDDTETTNIRFTLQNRPTYDAEVRSNFATIVYFSGTNMIGVQTVLPGDARVAVNTYVEKNFIHPDLRYSEHMNDADRTDYMDSLEREYNYRGKYPYDQPRPMDDPAGEPYTRTDGNDYPLTAHLDYAFYKRPTTYTIVEDPDGSLTPADDTPARWTGDEKVEWTAQDMSTVTDPTVADLPYINGWAVIDDLDDIENVWTTFGVGELANCNPASGTYSTEGDSAYFRFADFSDLKNGDVIYVRACYEPGPDLLTNFYYTITTEPTLRRYTYTASTSTGGATYAVQYQYERIINQNGLICGVSQARDPAVRVKFEPDVASRGVRKGEIDPFYMQQEVENEDVIDVILTPASSIVSMDYALVDRYGWNFMVGADRAASGDDRTPETITDDNFDYEHFTFDTRLGTEGLIYDATRNTLIEEGLKLVQGKDNVLSSHWGLETANDLNLRQNAKGDEFTNRNIAAARTTFTNMITAAINAGYTDEEIMNLSWHQMQYYFLHGVLKTDTEAKAEETYPWCRRLDGCISADVTVVSDLETLLKAADDAIIGNTASMDTLIDLALVNESPMYLRADEGGGNFTDLAAFKNQIIEVVRNAGTYELTWEQVQYALLHGNQLATNGEDTTAFNEDYWWYDGGRKLQNWNGFLNAVRDYSTTRRMAILNTAKDNWMNIVHNLATKDVVGDPITAVTPYTTDDLNLLRQHVTRALDAAALNNLQTPTWYQVQYYIIHNLGTPDQNSFPVAPTPDQQEEMDDYWWYDGGTRLVVTDVPTLLEAAKQANDGKPSALNKVTLDMINDTIGLRKDFKGTPFATLQEATDTICAMVNFLGRDYSSYDFARTQYYLIHNEPARTPAIANREAAYYWWENGGSPSPVGFTELPPTSVASESQLAGFIEELVDAAYRAVYNGNTAAWDNLTDDMLVGGRLIETEDPSITAFENLDKWTATDFAAQMEALVQTASGPQDAANPVPSVPILTWYQTQYAVLNGGVLRDDADIVADQMSGAINYWWKEKNVLSTVDPEAKFAELVAQLAILAAVNPDDDYDSFEANLDLFLNGPDGTGGWIQNADNLNDAGLLDPMTNFAKFTQDDYQANYLDADMWRTMGEQLAREVADGTIPDISDISWYQVEDLLANNGWGTTMPNDDAVADLIGFGLDVSYIPGWVQAKWPVTIAASAMLFSIRRNMAPNDQISDLTAQIQNLTVAIQEDPSMLEEYAWQIQELLAALEELKALVAPEELVITPPVDETQERPVETEGAAEQPEEPPVAPEEPTPEIPADSDTPEEPGESLPDEEIPPLSETPEEREEPAEEEKEETPPEMEKTEEPNLPSNPEETPPPDSTEEDITTDAIRQMISMSIREKTGGYLYTGINKLLRCRTGQIFSGSPPHLRSARHIVSYDPIVVNTFITGRIPA